MPGAAIGAASGVISGVQNFGSNLINMALNERNTLRNRRWNLEDWNRQNEYNSPVAQMGRLKAAGINPQTLFMSGGGGMGNSAAGALAPTSGQAPRWERQVPGTGVLDKYMDMKMKNAQVDNLTADVENKIETKQLIRAQTLGALSQTRGRDQETLFGGELHKYNLESAQEAIKKMQVETDISLKRNEREAIAGAASIKEAGMKYLMMQEQTKTIIEARKLLKYDRNIRRLESELAETGIMPGSDNWVKTVGGLLQQMSKDEESLNTIKEAIGSTLRDKANKNIRKFKKKGQSWMTKGMMKIRGWN